MTSTQQVTGARIFEADFALGEIVFLRVRQERKPGMVTGINFRPSGHAIAVTWDNGETWHYPIELTRIFETATVVVGAIEMSPPVDDVETQAVRWVLDEIGLASQSADKTTALIDTVRGMNRKRVDIPVLPSWSPFGVQTIKFERRGQGLNRSVYVEVPTGRDSALCREFTNEKVS